LIVIVNQSISPLKLQDSIALQAQFQERYAAYAASLDEQRYQDWLTLFAPDCEYKLQSRENFDRQLPLATLRIESKAMLQDRVTAILGTLFHAPYTQCHVIGPLSIQNIAATQAVDGPAVDTPISQVQVTARYSVFRTKFSQPSEVFNVGRYIDRWHLHADGQWLLQSKLVVFDSDLIANSLIHLI
jgi:salicylate 5-hydroxylase small subunit